VVDQLATIKADQTINANKAVSVALDFAATFTRNMFFAMAAHDVVMAAKIKGGRHGIW